MEQSGEAIEQLEERAEVSFVEGVRAAFLSGVDVAVDMVCRHLLAGSSLASASELTRDFWRSEFDRMQEARALQEFWRGVSGDGGRA